MKRKLKHFVGESHLVVDRFGRPIKFSTDAVNEGQGRRAIQRGMNARRGFRPEAFISMDVKEVVTSHK